MLALPEWARVSPKRVEHIGRVVALIDSWAATRRVGEKEAARWHRAALLHDALKDASPEELTSYAPQGNWHRALWHGPAAAAAARAHGESDQGVLDAIRYHSVGFKDWDDAGRMIYLADYLEPGRSHDAEGRAALAARVPKETAAVLQDVAVQRIGWLVQQRKPVQPETWDFWNSLARDASSSS